MTSSNKAWKPKPRVIPSKFTTPLGPHSILVQNHKSLGSPVISIDGNTYNHFRSLARESIFLSKPPTRLPLEDIEALNFLYNNTEGSINILMKEHLSDSLSTHFNGKRFRLYELGCGKHPIAPYFANNQLESYIGIDPDRHVIRNARKKGDLVHNWETIKRSQDTLSQSTVPSVTVAVYALHFLANRNLLKRIRPFMGRDGFFVANLFQNSTEIREKTITNYLTKLFSNKNMPHILLNNPTSPIFIVGNNPDDRTQIEDYSNILETTLSKQPTLSIKVA